jgi:D-3-phosphoglycerate dehydrogenase
MHIVIADPLPSSAVALLTSEPGWAVEVGPFTGDSLAAAVADADALIVRSATRVDAKLLAAAPKLRVVARAGTGVDNVDAEAATARGILVLNAPGANSVSVAEHACALMLALARSVTVADAAMKRERWEKKRLLGAELRGKTLGIVGLGRIGQEVVSRAAGFGMRLVAYDPYIPPHVAQALGVELVTLDDLCAVADYITLHVPSTQATRNLFDASRIAGCKAGVRIVNTARGDLIDQDALADAIESGHVAGAGLDVFAVEPPTNWRLASLPQVVATPHIAASTTEAQEQVGLETAASVRDFLLHGTIRSPVNFPAIGVEEAARLQPFLELGRRLGSLAAQLTTAPIDSIGIRYYGDLAEGSSEPLASAVLMGVFQAMLSGGVTMVNARSVAKSRGVDVIESRSSRPRNFTSLLSVKLHTARGERWAEGAVFEHGSPRLVLLDGVEIEAPLDGTLVVIANNDQPGVIGEVGTILGRHGINIANFALGRSPAGAMGVVNIDARGGTAGTGGPLSPEVLAEIRRVAAVREAHLVRVS